MLSLASKFEKEAAGNDFPSEFSMKSVLDKPKEPAEFSIESLINPPQSGEYEISDADGNSEAFTSINLDTQILDMRNIIEEIEKSYLANDYADLKKLLSELAMQTATMDAKLDQ